MKRVDYGAYLGAVPSAVGLQILEARSAIWDAREDRVARALGNVRGRQAMSPK